MRLRKLNRVLHRDLGYFFFGMTIIYALSGIALNHRHDWNPNYIITEKEFTREVTVPASEIDRDYALGVLADLDVTASYRTHLVAGENFRIFVEGGSVSINIAEGSGSMEIIRKRPVFNQINFLHYNTPRRLWTWFADIYAGSLIIIAITGLFIIRGKNGITGRGAWLAGLGIIIPLIFLWLYL
ncbi:MAG: hypothetical protein EA408_03530 [Marinilabiliales bacterium]|nr:MAG: hypothetical protein EA408_03530 [Marinilabiliales bacterium]